MKISFVAFILFATTLSVANAAPIEYKNGDFAARVSGYGNLGVIEPDLALNNATAVADWSVRGQMTYDINDVHRLGFVYSINDHGVEEKHYAHDLFALWQVSGYGRMEIGITESVAEKLGLGLPDVGGLRVNEHPLFYKEIKPHGPVITDITMANCDTSLRVNLVSAQSGGLQYGLSVAGLSDGYKYAIDGGIKIRRPNGKTKTAYSLGASFTASPDDMDQMAYAPHVTADWRAQLSAAMNVQYNSWIFGINSRVIYDKNPVGEISDGFAVGGGVSYDLLKYSISLSYLLSDTGVWQSDIDDYLDHTLLSSFRYKYSENVDGWMSVGITTKTPFVSAGLRVTF